MAGEFYKARHPLVAFMKKAATPDCALSTGLLPNARVTTGSSLLQLSHRLMVRSASFSRPLNSCLGRSGRVYRKPRLDKMSAWLQTCERRFSNEPVNGRYSMNGNGIRKLRPCCWTSVLPGTQPRSTYPGNCHLR